MNAALQKTNLEPLLTYTTFRDVRTPTGNQFCHTWAHVVKQLRNPKERASKSACPLLKLATFDGPRNDANVTQIWGVEVEHDRGDVTPAEAAERLRVAGILSLVYTTASHGVKGNRWRVLAPFSQSVAPAERAKYVSLINGALGGCASPESWTLSQIYYFGRVKGVGYGFHEIAGEHLDVLEARGAAPAPIESPTKAKQPVTTQTGAPSPARSDGELTQAVEEALARAKADGVTEREFTGEGDRSARDFAVCCALAPYAPDADLLAALAMTSELVSEKWHERGEKYQHETARKALAKTALEVEDLSTEGEKAAPRRRQLLLHAGELHTYVAEAERELAEEVYVRERQLVRLGGAPEIADPGVNRDERQAVILEANTAWVRRRLNARRQFMRFDRRDGAWRTTDCPRDLADNIVGIGDWPHLRPLEAIARAPFLRPDGSLCATSGYDRDSRVFYAPNGAFPAINPAPTKDEAHAALRGLLAPFEEFPYATPEARSAFAALILTEAVRLAVGTVPVFVLSAAEPGTGKTLLAGMPSRIVHGVGPAVRQWVEDEELRKTLFSSLLAGDRTLLFDNINEGAKLHSAVLCAAVTGAKYSDRMLGSSRNVDVPNRATVLMTGNNINPVGDLARRALVIRLDANLDRADLRARQFDIADLAGYVAEHRGELLAMALTVLMAHRAAGYHGSGAAALPSFEGWSRLVRDALTWLDMPDPVATQDQETDDGADARGRAFALIAAAVGKQPDFSAEELANLAGVNDALSEALSASGCRAPLDAVRCGYWLRGHRDRVAGGWKLRTGARYRWTLERVTLW